MSLKKAIVIFIFFTLLAVACSQSSLAAPPQCTANGCGPSGFPKWFTRVLSNPFNCKLRIACDRHDRCYAKCGKGCELFGTKKCSSNNKCSKDGVYKKQCDDKLYADIISTNDGRCRRFAWTYFELVWWKGCDYYKGQASAGKTLSVQQDFNALKNYYNYKLGEKLNLTPDELEKKLESDDIFEDLNPAEIDKILNTKEIDSVFKILVAIGANEENSLKFTTPKNGETGLSIEAIKPLPQSFVPLEKGIQGTRLLNGIDITNMRLKDGRFDLRDVINENKKLELNQQLDIKGLKQTDSLGVPAQ